MRAKKLAIVSRECVACGCCARVCPLDAVTIFRGKLAVVNERKCVGCGKCAACCPAGIIEIVTRKEDAYESAEEEAVV